MKKLIEVIEKDFWDNFEIRHERLISIKHVISIEIPKHKRVSIKASNTTIKATRGLINMLWKDMKINFFDIVVDETLEFYVNKVLEKYPNKFNHLIR